MVLLERYLHAVEGHLPAKSRGDIITELREDLRAQFEDRAVALGRPLSEDEQAALLRPYGRSCASRVNQNCIFTAAPDHDDRLVQARLFAPQF